MDTRNIIVIGASAGGLAVVQRLVADLRSDLPDALFVVWHMPPGGPARALEPGTRTRAAGGCHGR